MKTIKINGVQLTPKAIEHLKEIQEKNGELISHYTKTIYKITGLLSSKDNINTPVSSIELLGLINTLSNMCSLLDDLKKTSDNY